MKQNLADARKLIPLMRSRAGAVRDGTEQLLAALTHGIDTDDGSIAPAIVPEQPTTEGSQEAGTAADPAKKAAAKLRLKNKPPTTGPARRLLTQSRPQ